MSDFHDFLKHEQAHVVIGEFKPGTFCEAQRLYNRAVSTYQDGFREAFLLREPGSDRGISIILWNSVDQMDEQQRNNTHQAILKEMNPLFKQVPHSEVYELASHITPQGIQASGNVPAGVLA